MKFKIRHAVLIVFTCATVAVVLNREAVEASIESYAQSSIEATLDIPDDPYYGPKPSRSACERDFRAFLKRLLLDYDSAKIEWSETDLKGGAFKIREEYKKCWYTDVRVNSKNKFGAYVGWTNYSFGWNSEKRLSMYSDDGGRTGMMIPPGFID